MRHQTRTDTVQPKSIRSNNLICIDMFGREERNKGIWSGKGKKRNSWEI